jgi:ATP-binding cassette, subfamily B, bacterial
MSNHPILEIRNLAFSYKNPDKVIFKNVTLSLEKGKKYALIGPTGEGKSTLAMLIAGLISPTKGDIFYDGKLLSSYSRSQIANSIGFILQEPFLFEGTVGENILYGNNLSEKDLIQTLSQKDLKNLINTFPNGLETKVTNNSENISLGQKQIVNFLRVILRNPKFLILDEATANLDTITEGYLQKILNNLSQDITMVIIAHRLNTVKNVDVKFQVGGGIVKVI